MELETLHNLSVQMNQVQPQIILIAGDLNNAKIQTLKKHENNEEGKNKIRTTRKIPLKISLWNDLSDEIRISFSRPHKETTRTSKIDYILTSEQNISHQTEQIWISQQEDDSIILIRGENTEEEIK